MKQGALAGRTTGLRPSERRRLERLCHRRHPVDGMAEVLALERLAAESRSLALPLTLVMDGRGLCRLLWVGDLDQSGRLIEKLPGSSRRQGRDLRLVTCVGGKRHPSPHALGPNGQEAIVALDLAPLGWLRYSPQPSAGGLWPAALFVPKDRHGDPWVPFCQGNLEDLCGLDPLALNPTREEPPAGPHRGDAGGEKVLLLALSGGARQEAARRISELEGLVRSAGAQPVGIVEQRRQSLAPQTLWGEGKLREAALEARRVEADLVVTDRELTPGQARNLERVLDLPVSDRSELILDIFAQRAASGAGRLQVELAQLRYRLPRLSGRGLSLSRQGGGIGTRGPGETQLEKDRRAISRRIERLQREVKQLGAHRSRLRQARGGIHRIALVGYTNAGKSSLLNAFIHTGASDAVLAEDKLFATLDPTTRRLTLLPPDGKPPTQMLVTDTVGFIRDLPPTLIEAFQSTIEEALDADGLLVVVDLSDPAWPEQLHTVHGILDSLRSDAPRLVIGNQIDRCPAGELERARTLDASMLFVSATQGLGLNYLRRHLLTWPHPMRDLP